MTKETKPDQKEEIPHRELRIQWHEDMLHHLRTGEPMREWEYRLKNGDGEWKICHDPHFSEKYEYRRKPRTVTYWHCVFKDDNGNVFPKASILSKEDLRNYMERHYKRYKKSQIIETTVELED